MVASAVASGSCGSWYKDDEMYFIEYVDPLSRKLLHSFKYNRYNGNISIVTIQTTKSHKSAIYYNLIYCLWSLHGLEKMSKVSNFGQSYAIISSLIRHFVVCGFKGSRADWLHVNFKSLNHNWLYLASMISAAWMNTAWTGVCVAVTWTCSEK